MKMGSWVLVDKEDERKVIIYKDGSPKQGIEKRIYKASLVEFDLIYSSQGKMLGYALKYKYNKEYPKFSLFNCFGLFYNLKPEVNNMKLEVIYDDQVVRFMAAHHESGIKDYLLFGRWRTETELPSEEEAD